MGSANETPCAQGVAEYSIEAERPEVISVEESSTVESDGTNEGVTGEESDWRTTSYTI